MFEKTKVKHLEWQNKKKDEEIASLEEQVILLTEEKEKLLAKVEAVDKMYAEDREKLCSVVRELRDKIVDADNARKKCESALEATREMNETYKSEFAKLVERIRDNMDIEE